MMVKVKAYDAMKTMKRSREDVNSAVFPSDVSPLVDGTVLDPFPAPIE